MTLRGTTILESPIFWILLSIYLLTILITAPITLVRDKKLRREFSLYKEKLINEDFMKKYKSYLNPKFRPWWNYLSCIGYYVVMMGVPLLLFFNDYLNFTSDFFMIIVCVCYGFGGLLIMVLSQRKARKRLYREINEK